MLAFLAGQDSAACIQQVAMHDYMLVDFALGLLHTGLKKGTLGGQSPEALAMLDPMLPLLVRALRSRHANSVSLALKCLAFLIRLPLPGHPQKPCLLLFKPLLISNAC